MSTTDDTPDVPTKQCTKCEQVFPTTIQYFYKNLRYHGGLTAWCKQCLKICSTALRTTHPNRQKAYSAKYRQTHLEKERERTRKYNQDYRKKYPHKVRLSQQAHYRKNAAKRRADAKQYRQIHIEERQAYDRAYHASNRDARLAYAQQWRKDHQEVIQVEKHQYYQSHKAEKKLYNSKYRQAHLEELRKKESLYKATHPEVKQAAQKRRRARKHNAPINDFTAAQWREMQAAYDHRCAYCHKRCKGKLTQDHLEPLSKGGSHTKKNIVPACRACNSRKHTGPPIAPVQPMLL